MNKNYDILDLTKFVCSIIIVGLHSFLLYDYNEMLNFILFRTIGRLAVPLFFIITAFLFYKNGDPDKNKIKKYCSRMFLLYVCWFIINIPKIYFDRFYCGGYTIKIKILVFIKSFFVTSTFSGSWFLVSCIFSVLILYYINKLPQQFSSLIIVIFSIVCYVFCVSSSAYGKLFYSEETIKQIYLYFAKPYTSILVGIPYFSIVRYLIINEKILSIKISKRKIIYSLLFSLMLLILEAFITYKLYNIQQSTDCYLILLPCSLLLFIFLISFDININYSKTLRSYSTIIFFSHFLWLFICEIIEWFFKVNITYSIKFIISLTFSLFVSFIILKMETRKHFHWLNYLH